MSDYGDYERPRRYKMTRTRPRESDDAEFVEETTYVERGKGPPPRDLMYRSREEDVEEVDRDFPPPGSSRASRRSRNSLAVDDYADKRRSRSALTRRNDYDDDYDDYAATAGGAAAGYAAGRDDRRDDRRTEKYERRRSDRKSYYSDDDSRSPPRDRKKDRRKSGVEEMLEGLGLGGVAGALAGRSKGGRGSRRDESESRSRSRSRSHPRGAKRERQWAQAAQAAIIAGAVEAFRARGEPGPWLGGDKGKRIATAAISAGGIDRLVDRNPDKKSKRHLAEAVLGGLAANRLANGPRSKSRGRGLDDDEDSDGRGRSRSRSILDRFRSKSRGRSQSRDGKSGNSIKDLAAGGALAAAGKAIYDRVRSKSRGNRKDRSPSSASEDSYVPSRSRRRDRDVGDSKQSSRDLPPDRTAVVNRSAVGPVAGVGAAAERQRNGGDYDHDDDGHQSSTSESSTDMEQKRKRMKGKELLTAGLASIATIHAAHGVYSSMVASEKRHKQVVEGEMSPEEAKKKQTKAWLQDAAAVGIAALGIKGAYSEWKEMNEHRHEIRELEEKKRMRQKRRQKRLQDAQRDQGGENGAGPYMSGGADGGNRRITAPGYGGPPPVDNGYYQDGGIPKPPMGGSSNRY